MRFLGKQNFDGLVPTAAIADDGVTEAKIANDAIGLAELKAGTDGEIISWDASGDPVFIATGDDGEVLTSAGAGAPPAFEAVSAGMTNISEVAATSGTSVTVSGIGASADFVYMTLEDINMTGSAVLKLRIGPSGGVATSGYLNSGGDLEAADSFVNLTSTTYFNVSNVSNTNDVKQGHILMTHHGGNIWMCSWQMGDSSQNSVALGAGKILLSGALQQVQFYGGTFEGANGAIAVGYL